MSTQKRTPLTPTKTQQEAIDIGIAHYSSSNDRGLLVISCGGGKTLVSIKIVEGTNPPVRRVLVVVPTLLLVRQTIEDWIDNWGRTSLDVIAACSEKGVKDGISVDDIRNVAGISVATNVSELAKHIGPDVPRGHTQLVVTTYASLLNVSEAIEQVNEGRDKYDRLQFDYVVGDENHHTAGALRKRATKKEKAYKAIHDNSMIPAARRLNMTATPRTAPARSRSNKKNDSTKEVDTKKFGVGDKELFDMSDTSIYGQVFFELPLTEAIRRDDVRVTPYRIIPHYVRRSDLKFAMSEEHELPFNTLADGEAAAAYTLLDLMDQRGEELGLDRVITYHAGVANAEAMTNALNKLNDTRDPSSGKRIEADHLNGTMKMDLRTQKLDRFSEYDPKRHSIITNDQALTEGLNVKGANGLVFVDSKSSVIEIMQAIGRLIRKDDRNPDKVATVIIPMVVDDTNPDEPFVEEESIQRLRKILYAAKLIDDDVIFRLPLTSEEKRSESGETLERLISDAAIKEVGEPALPLPQRDFKELVGENGDPRIARMMHIEQGWVMRQAVEKVIAGIRKELQSVSGREYDGVSWNPRTGSWESKIINPWWNKPDEVPEGVDFGNNMVIDLGDHYPTAFDAVWARNDFIFKHKLPIKTEFVRNPEYPEEWPENIRSRFPGKTSFAPSRTRRRDGKYNVPQWRGYVHVPDALDEDGTLLPKSYRIVCRYLPTEEEAALAHDALCERYGLVDEKIGPDAAVRWDLILQKPGSQYYVEEGIEREQIYRNVPAKRFWAYVKTESEDIIPLGHYATVEDGRRAREVALKALSKAKSLEEAALAVQSALEAEFPDNEAVRGLQTRILEGIAVDEDEEIDLSHTVDDEEHGFKR